MRSPFRLTWILLSGAALWLCYHQISLRLGLPVGQGIDINRIIVIDSLLPRAAVALLCGAALGLSGALLQQVLRNPIADSSTLGISAGAQLAMTAATLFAPAWMDTSREIVALLGGVGAVILLLMLTWKRGLEPLTVVLAGMVVSLIALALSAALILANGEYMMSLFIWGSGSLSQQGWDHAQTIAIRLVVAFGVSALLLRPLAILGLDDASARNLGISLSGMRFLILSIAVWLASTVTAEVGVIGFIGLAAPTLARLSGARIQRDILILAPIIGAIVLWLTDGVVQFTAGGMAETVPTGAATALLGGPFLLFLLSRLHLQSRAPAAMSSRETKRMAQPLLPILIMGGLIVALMAAALTIGRGPDGWNIATGTLLEDLLPFRAPRILAAASAGAMLAAAGTIIQRVTGNPLASPEVLGVSAGAGMGLAVALFVFTSPGVGLRLAAATAGVLLALIVILLISRQSKGGPERLLLSGIAVGALCSAIVNAAMVTGDARAFQLLAWISGSTNDVTWSQAWITAALALIAIGPLPLMTRWLQIFPLGPHAAQAIGLNIRFSQTILILFSAILTAAASLVVGPLSFVGLVAPHMARLLGFGTALYQLVASILLGIGLMVTADWFCRTITFPYQLPLGLFASLIGGPYLIWLLRRAG